MKHAPTPWGFGCREETTVCTDSGEGMVIHRPHSDREFSHDELSYIIHCVNNHADMLEALELVQQYWATNPGLTYEITTMEAVEKAIAKAKGE